MKFNWLHPKTVGVPEDWHIHFIEYLASVVRPRVYVELGLYHCETFNRIIPYAEHLVGVDRNPASGTYMAKSPKVQFICSSTQDFARYLTAGFRIDMLFIDANHAAEAVLEDFHNCFPSVAPQGLVLLHDTHPKNKAFAVPSLCGDAYLAAGILSRMAGPDYETVTIPVHPGLTIIRKRTKQLTWEEEGK